MLPLLLPLALLAAPELKLPKGAPVTLDGRVVDEEWSDASRIARALPSGAKLEAFFKRNGACLALGIRANRTYAAETARLNVADEAGGWVVSLFLGIGLPHPPPVLWRRAPPDLVTRRLGESPRGCRARVSVGEEGKWEAEYLLSLGELGIGLGDRRSFRAVFVVGSDSEGELLAFPEGLKGYLDPALYAPLVSPDGWGAGETPPAPDPALSREYDDNELLHRLYQEHEKVSRREAPGQFVIWDACHERSTPRIELLRKQLEEGRGRNPTLPAWSYYLGRLLHEANLFAAAEQVILSVPPPLRSLDAFVSLEAEHFVDLEQVDRAFEACDRNPRAQGVSEARGVATVLREALAQEAAAREADAKKAERNPRVLFRTAKGEIECELFEDDAPNAVRNFIDLVLREKFYDRLKFHAVVGGAGVRTGDPRTRIGSPARTDGPPWRLDRNKSRRRMLRGSVAMLPEPGGALHGSQLTISVAPLLRMEEAMEVFGRVVRGIETVEALDQDDDLISVEIVERRNHVYDPGPARLR